MKRDNENTNVFVAQMSKLFGDLSHRTPEEPKRPIPPRMTCTRLRRFRETKQDLLLESEFGLNNGLTQTLESDGEVAGQEEGEGEGDTKETFAEWVVRNQQAHKQLAEKKYSESKAIERQNHKYIEDKDDEANRTIQGFAHFSSEALLEVASNPETPEVTLKWLAAHYDAKVREALATNQALAADIVRILVRDGEASVRKVALENKNIREADLLRLCGDSDQEIAEKAKYILTLRHRPEEGNHRRAMAATANIDVSKGRVIRRKRK